MVYTLLVHRKYLIFVLITLSRLCDPCSAPRPIQLHVTICLLLDHIDVHAES